MKELPDKALLKPKEVEEFFGVNIRTVYNWCLDEKLKYTKLGTIIRIYRDSVIKFQKKRKVKVKL